MHNGNILSRFDGSEICWQRKQASGLKSRCRLHFLPSSPTHLTQQGNKFHLFFRPAFLLPFFIFSSSRIIIIISSSKCLVKMIPRATPFPSRLPICSDWLLLLRYEVTFVIIMQYNLMPPAKLPTLHNNIKTTLSRPSSEYLYSSYRAEKRITSLQLAFILVFPHYFCNKHSIHVEKVASRVKCKRIKAFFRR